MRRQRTETVRLETNVEGKQGGRRPRNRWLNTVNNGNI